MLDDHARAILTASGAAGGEEALAGDVAVVGEHGEGAIERYDGLGCTSA